MKTLSMKWQERIRRAAVAFMLLVTAGLSIATSACEEDSQTSLSATKTMRFEAGQESAVLFIELDALMVVLSSEADVSFSEPVLNLGEEEEPEQNVGGAGGMGGNAGDDMQAEEDALQEQTSAPDPVNVPTPNPGRFDSGLFHREQEPLLPEGSEAYCWDMPYGHNLGTSASSLAFGECSQSLNGKKFVRVQVTRANTSRAESIVIKGQAFSNPYCSDEGPPDFLQLKMSVE